ncbi:MAG: inositol monophosphatase [Armatimonadetes bacterium]|nr:inositol monophosphatase [Armatimonadota bacterium]
MDLPDVEVVKKIVVQVGNRARERRAGCESGGIDLEYKEDQSYVTPLDRETEQYLKAEMAALTPGFAFLGEEYGITGDSDRPLWACDPIDGTTNMVFGIPVWGVSLGLIYNQVPVLGVIYLPLLGELFWATKNGGAWCNQQRLQVTDQDNIHIEDTICFTSNALKTLSVERIGGRLRCLGSIAAELGYTARGSICATVGLHEGICDMAAGFCIATEAGCAIHYLHSERSNDPGEPVDIGALVAARRTERHFVVGPPQLINYLQRNVFLR